MLQHNGEVPRGPPWNSLPARPVAYCRVWLEMECSTCLVALCQWVSARACVLADADCIAAPGCELRLTARTMPHPLACTRCYTCSPPAVEHFTSQGGLCRQNECYIISCWLAFVLWAPLMIRPAWLQLPLMLYLRVAAAANRFSVHAGLVIGSRCSAAVPTVLPAVHVCWAPHGPNL